MPTLDTFLPRFDLNETHSIFLACDAERALDLGLTAPAAPGRLVAALFRARGLPPTTSVKELFDWVVVGPFSGLVRRRWLGAARDATTLDASGGRGARS